MNLEASDKTNSRVGFAVKTLAVLCFLLTSGLLASSLKQAKATRLHPDTHHTSSLNTPISASQTAKIGIFRKLNT